MKRATNITQIDYISMIISIHALVKRATMRFISADKNSFYFNPRPREEGDGFSVDVFIVHIRISIHALVKRATTQRIQQSTQVLNFNPRPREEGDEVSRSPIKLV